MAALALFQISKDLCAYTRVHLNAKHVVFSMFDGVDVYMYTTSTHILTNINSLLSPLQWTALVLQILGHDANSCPASVWKLLGGFFYVYPQSTSACVLETGSVIPTLDLVARNQEQRTRAASENLIDQDSDDFNLDAEKRTATH